MMTMVCQMVLVIVAVMDGAVMEAYSSSSSMRCHGSDQG
jgi:hypothetical protein